MVTRTEHHPHLTISDATCCRCGKLMREAEKRLARRGEIFPGTDKPWVILVVCQTCLRKLEEK